MAKNLGLAANLPLSIAHVKVGPNLTVEPGRGHTLLNFKENVRVLFNRISCMIKDVIIHETEQLEEVKCHR